MSDSVNLEEIKNYIEGPSHEHPCTISVPKYVSITIEVFLNEILQRIQKEPSQITPQDIVELIKNIPEYKFLLPVIEKIPVH